MPDVIDLEAVRVTSGMDSFEGRRLLARIDRKRQTAPRTRRPCPTGIPGDGVTPYRPSRCATECTCCAWCRGEGPDEPRRCTCPRQGFVERHVLVAADRGVVRMSDAAPIPVTRLARKPWWRRLFGV